MIKEKKSTHPAHQSALRWQITSILLIVSLLPIFLMGFGAWVVFGRLLEQKASELQRVVVLSHAREIESYLEEHLHLLQFIASSYPLSQLSDQAQLNILFISQQSNPDGGFIDLGVIGAEGSHLAYVGPYDLLDKNYANTEWFRIVRKQAFYISDVFLGYRNEPHCIIAVKIDVDQTFWILRGTINSKHFDSIVSRGDYGKSGDAFIINGEGIYQTTPKVGAMLEKAPLPMIEPHDGVLDRRLKLGGKEKILATTWLNENRWMLAVLQDAEEIRAPVTRAITRGASVALVGIVLAVVTIMIATGYLTSRIDKANKQREEIFTAFLRSAKLASIGELATGLAHEINNPLAILSAEQTNISDLTADLKINDEEREELTKAVDRCQRQIKRCAGITAKMLQFGRKREASREAVDVSPRLQEVIAMMQRQAEVRNIGITLSINHHLPQVMIDGVEFEQIMVNLINNSFHALPRGGQIHITAGVQNGKLQVEVRDNGSGISPDHLEHIFEPFFTTKPPGEGTGLGLSICYGIIRSWGGDIEAESESGKGTTMRIRLPIPENRQMT